MICRNMNILDTMVQKLEKYANNLEDIVEHRTVELVQEKRKTDQLLYKMLPRFVKCSPLKQIKNLFSTFQKIS